MKNIQSISGRTVKAVVQSGGNKVSLCIDEPAQHGRGTYYNTNLSASAARELAFQLTDAANEVQNGVLRSGRAI